MAVYTCPKGHSSTENDYCSECGAKIDGAPSGAGGNGAGSGSGNRAQPGGSGPTTPPVAVTGQACPDCGFRREPGPGDYCEVCGFNFKTGAHGEIPMPPGQPAPVVSAAPLAVTPAPTPTAAPVPPPPPEAAPAAAAPAPGTLPPPPVETKIIGWEITMTVDPTLKVEGSPDPPASFEPVVAALRVGSNLIGRSSPRRGIEPEVALDHDDAVSHRHALLEVHGDGALTLRDIGSSNGTSVNGKEIKQLEDVPLNDGDQVTLGHWTRLLVKAVR